MLPPHRAATGRAADRAVGAADRAVGSYSVKCLDRGGCSLECSRMLDEVPGQCSARAWSLEEMLLAARVVLGLNARAA